ncbi:glyoxylase-like metal-dependent hydrolase (beta-lactamase superfamily II) [Scopulibacillus darangshiensis]|uniref:Glyoxylase-like metal-dependent hydrolase (Beta-lactamase superfamily II) n=1 Tax=Scopulibacillus darangshiensis TaxID=442528 RepID=A0A4R2NVJ3_9BACL|nr:MBL fold metallo-hydrolase [Scopulibacillus darangshiensis]TCP25621.1 glyoxylase-like metal-dependent hydrolase (beta-lactamase superfamily II) [Scopulibacillus darangshiensis]
MNEKIGPIEIIMGDNKSRVPFSTSLLIAGQEHSTLIDCGAGQTAFEYMKKEHRVMQIYLTHHHFDHIWGAHLFPEAEKLINHNDVNKISDINEIGKAMGIYAVFRKEEIEKWIESQQNKKWQGKVLGKRTLDVTGSYRYDEEIEMSGVKVSMIHAPGHSEGFCCPYIPDYGILLVGDIDLTTFGPFYGDADSNIDQFIESAKKTLEFDVKYYVTSHQKGMYLKKEYKHQLEKYLLIIERREKKIKQAIHKGDSPQQLVQQDIFYYKKQYERNLIFMKNEILSIAKHLKRLIDHGEPYEDYYEEFITAHNLNRKYMEYSSG